jgi:TonB family protein
MYFDFEDAHPEFTPVGRAISWREGVLLSIILHLILVIIVLIWWPTIFSYRLRPRQQLLLAQQQPQEPTTFVYMAPRVDTPAPRPPVRGPDSDKDRLAQAPQRAEKPDNLEPLSRGTSPERVEAAPPPEVARGRGPEPEPQQPPQPPPSEAPKLQEAPQGLTLPSRPPQTQENAAPGYRSGGSLGDALRNFKSYTAPPFKNLQGGTGQYGDAIQFDSKGVEFGPWIRRFVERVRNNWNVPQAAMYLHGHVRITFNIHKNGSITDLSVIGPAQYDSFNTAAMGALVASSPTEPLPPEYPDPQAFFTVTFYYNEEVR